MLIYGIKIQEEDFTTNEKLETFLEYLCVNNFNEPLKDRKINYGLTALEWLDNYDDNLGNTGIAALLKDAISEIDKINITCDMPNETPYLGIQADAPWLFNQKTKNLTSEEFQKILCNYTQRLTDKKFDVKWYSILDN